MTEVLDNSPVSSEMSRYNELAREVGGFIEAAVGAGGEKHHAVRDFVQSLQLENRLKNVSPDDPDGRQQVNAEIGAHRAFMYQAGLHPQYEKSLLDMERHWKIVQAAASNTSQDIRDDVRADAFVVCVTSLTAAESAASSRYFQQQQGSSHA